MSEVLRIARYRLGATASRRMPGYLGLVLLIALLGGVALGSISGARATETSFPAYVASTNPSTIGLISRYDDPELGISTGYDPHAAAAIAHLPLVRRAATAIIFDGNIDLDAITGAHLHDSAGEAPPTFLGSPDGELTSMDRGTLLAGRLPTRVDEAAINAQAGRQTGLRVGSVVRIPIYTDAQLAQRGPSRPRWLTLTVVGEVVYPQDVLESDIGALNSATVLFSPALSRELEDHYATGTEQFLQLAGGTRNAKRVLAAAYRVDPAATHFPARVTTSFEPSAQQAIAPEAVALGVFGVLAGLSALLIAGLSIGRLLRSSAAELDTLHALGASRAILFADGFVGVLVATVVGSLAAVGVAVLLSPLAPLGPVRAVEHPRFHEDWRVLGLGLVLLVVTLGSIAAIDAAREVRRHRAGAHELRASGSARWARTVSSLALPVSAETGIRFATEPGGGPSSAPVRSAMLGAVLAVTVLTAALTFGASLNSLVSRPALYGWNWNYALLASFAGAEDLPAHQVATWLRQDRDVAAWSGVNLVGSKLDGQRVQAIAEQPGSSVQPPVLDGHGLEASDQVVLGGATLSALHEHLGGTVMLSDGITAPVRLSIVGVATMPALGQDTGAGTGALLSTSDFPAALLNLQDAELPGPNAVLVRIRPGVAPSAAIRSLDAVNRDVNRLPASSGLGGGVIGALRPVEIVNFRSMGTTPALLAAALALGAVVALGLTLAASVRRRRRELALLKTLGFTRRQLAASIAWQATTAAFVGVLVGVPIGVAIGRQVWILFAKSINVVPLPVVGAVDLLLVGVGTVAFAILVSVLPGRSAARTPAALVLRSE